MPVTRSFKERVFLWPVGKKTGKPLLQGQAVGDLKDRSLQGRVCWLKKTEGLDLFFFFDTFCVCAKCIKKRTLTEKCA